MIATIFTSFTNLIPTLAAHNLPLVYGLLFLVIFAETGLVVLPFLPGDSLLFLAGTVCSLAGSALNPFVVVSLLMAAAALGDGVNYFVGQNFGRRLLQVRWVSRIVTPEHIEQAAAFFQRHGNFAIFLARFVPLVRTLVPFVAGVSRMHRKQFGVFNICGGVLWVNIGVWAGYLFGNVPAIKNHVELIMLAVVLVSLIPAGVMMLRTHYKTLGE